MTAETEQTKESIAAQIAEMKAKQAEQREAMKAQREAAAAQLAIQREELKAQREAMKAQFEAAKAEAKAAREAERAAKAEAMLAKEKEKMQKRAERDAERLAREKAKLEAMQNRLSNPRAEQNGVREPDPDTITGRLWGIFNDMSASKGAPVSIAEVTENPDTKEFNEATLRTQYARWKQFHGILGRVAKPEAEEKQAA